MTPAPRPRTLVQSELGVATRKDCTRAPTPVPIPAPLDRGPARLTPSGGERGLCPTRVHGGGESRSRL